MGARFRSRPCILGKHVVFRSKTGRASEPARPGHFTTDCLLPIRRKEAVLSRFRAAVFCRWVLGGWGYVLEGPDWYWHWWCGGSV